MRPKLYLETTIPSYLAGRPSKVALIREKQNITHFWWDHYRVHYELVSSIAVRDECSDGNQSMAEQRLHYLDKVQLLVPNDTDPIVTALMEKVAIPERAGYDAVHIAIAAQYNVSYILTWNFKHLANARLWPTIRKVLDTFGLSLPTICSPEQLMGAEQ